MAKANRARRFAAPGSSSDRARTLDQDVGDVTRANRSRQVASITKTGTLTLEVNVVPWHGRFRIEFREVATVIPGACHYVANVITFEVAAADPLIDALERAKEAAT